MLLSIVTATYNRAYRLPVAYESLCKQTDKDFEWIIIDDGSSDNTSILVNAWIMESKLMIRYFFKENGGMNSAIDFGIKEAVGKMIIKLDSDDIFKENTVERIRFHTNSYIWVNGTKRPERSLCGMCFLNQDIRGEIIGDRFRQDSFIGNYICVRINGRIRGDKSEVCLADRLREVPAMSVKGEKDNSGSRYRWIFLSRHYDMLFLNESIYVRDYLSDGMTKNTPKYDFLNPRRSILHYRIVFEEKAIKLKIRLVNAARYIMFCMLVKQPVLTEYSYRTRIPLLVAYPLGTLLYIVHKREYESLQITKKN